MMTIFFSQNEYSMLEKKKIKEINRKMVFIEYASKRDAQIKAIENNIAVDAFTFPEAMGLFLLMGCSFRKACKKLQIPIL
jgi:hypothetical protein